MGACKIEKENYQTASQGSMQPGTSIIKQILQWPGFIPIHLPTYQANAQSSFLSKCTFFALEIIRPDGINFVFPVSSG